MKRLLFTLPFLTLVTLFLSHCKKADKPLEETVDETAAKEASVKKPEKPAIEPRSLRVDNFDSPGLSNFWRAQGALKIKRAERPSSAPSEMEGSHVVSITAEEGRSVFFGQRAQIDSDILNFGEVELWIHRPDTAAGTELVLEVGFHIERFPSRLWRKLPVDHTGWKAYRLPLKWFRKEGTLTPSWFDVSFMSVGFRTPGEVSLGAIKLLRSEKAHAPYMTGADWQSFVAETLPNLNTQLIETEQFIILAGDQQGDLDELAKKLKEADKAVRERFPSFFKTPTQGQKPTLIITNEHEEYQRLVPKVAEAQMAGAAAPQAGGYSFDGYAFSSSGSEETPIRPVFIHEYIHALVELHARIPSRNGWLQEGVASLIQDDMFSVGLKGAIQNYLDGGSGVYLSPVSLLGMERVSLSSYWQAAALVDMLADHPSYEGSLDNVIAHSKETHEVKITDIEKVFGVSKETFEADYIEHLKVMVEKLSE